MVESTDACSHSGGGFLSVPVGRLRVVMSKLCRKHFGILTESCWNHVEIELLFVRYIIVPRPFENMNPLKHTSASDAA